MKKSRYYSVLVFVLLVFCSFFFSSCATIFGGPVGACQRTRPLPGQQMRQIRPVPLVADIILFWPAVLIDFGTGAIYRPCDNPRQSISPGN